MGTEARSIRGNKEILEQIDIKIKINFIAKEMGNSQLLKPYSRFIKSKKQSTKMGVRSGSKPVTKELTAYRQGAEKT